MKRNKFLIIISLALISTGFSSCLNDDMIEDQKYGLINLNANNLLDKTYTNHLSRLKTDGINNMGKNVILSLNFDL